MSKKHPNKARGAYTVQENMKRKYQEEAFRELANFIESQLIDPFITEEGSEYVSGTLTIFMQRKGIEPKSDL